MRRYLAYQGQNRVFYGLWEIYCQTAWKELRIKKMEFFRILIRQPRNCNPKNIKVNLQFCL